MLDRDRYWDCLDQAIEASSGGRNEEALAWLEEALRANPSGAEARNGLGEILWDDGRFEDALREFDRAIDADSALSAAQLNRIEILVEEFQEFEEALEIADDLLNSALEPGVEAEVYYLKAKALFYLDDLDGALFLLRRAIQTYGEVAVYRAFQGQILFEMGQFDGARQDLERARALEPDSAHTLYHLALVYEHLANRDLAAGLFNEAASLAPDLYPLPVRMEVEEFERVAAESIRTLPARLRDRVKNCPIVIEDLPDRELVLGENVSPQLMGLFLGTPHSLPESAPWSAEAVSEPTRILLFKRNLEKVAQSREHLIEQIQITVKHEIGHYLGLDEEELDRLGLG
jgi:predicted Zn-dependent protease with MMP-like domain/Flp pilus assembly protein TadD